MTSLHGRVTGWGLRLGMVAVSLTVACRQSAPVSSTRSPTVVNALGKLEPENGIVRIAVPPGERLAEVYVSADSSVPISAGVPLARLESYPLRKHEYDLAMIQLSEAKARLAAVRASGQQQLAEAQLKLQMTQEIEPLEIKVLKDKAQYLEKARANVTHQREVLRSLQKSTVPEQQLEQQDLLLAQAEAELSAARSQLEKAERGHVLNVLAAEEQLRTIDASLKRAEQEIPMASLEKAAEVSAERLKFAEIRAPERPGRMTVLQVTAHPGEALGGQAAFCLGDTSQMVVVAEVYETDIHRVRPGQVVQIRSRALEEPLQAALGRDYLMGTVQSTGKTVARNGLVDLNPAAEVDRRVVAVRIQLERSDLVARYVNLEVQVAIEVEGKTPEEAPGGLSQ